MQASKAPKNFRHEPSNTKNIRREIIQIIFLDLKGHWNQAPKPLEISINHKSSETLWIQASKAPKNFHHKPLNTKNIQRGIIQIIFLDLKVHWNQAQKTLETSTNHKLVKLYGFKPPKPRRTSTTNLQIRRTFETESSKLPA